MKIKKYTIYHLITETDGEHYYDYKRAFSAYQNYEGSATLYGIDNQGSIHIIFSK